MGRSDRGATQILYNINEKYNKKSTSSMLGRNTNIFVMPPMLHTHYQVQILYRYPVFLTADTRTPVL